MSTTIVTSIILFVLLLPEISTAKPHAPKHIRPPDIYCSPLHALCFIHNHDQATIDTLDLLYQSITQTTNICGHLHSIQLIETINNLFLILESADQLRITLYGLQTNHQQQRQRTPLPQVKRIEEFHAGMPLVSVNALLMKHHESHVSVFSIDVHRLLTDDLLINPFGLRKTVKKHRINLPEQHLPITQMISSALHHPGIIVFVFDEGRRISIESLGQKPQPQSEREQHRVHNHPICYEHYFKSPHLLHSFTYLTGYINHFHSTAALVYQHMHSATFRIDILTFEENEFTDLIRCEFNLRGHIAKVDVSERYAAFIFSDNTILLHDFSQVPSQKCVNLLKPTPEFEHQEQLTVMKVIAEKRHETSVLKLTAVVGLSAIGGTRNLHVLRDQSTVELKSQLLSEIPNRQIQLIRDLNLKGLRVFLAQIDELKVSHFLLLLITFGIILKIRQTNTNTNNAETLPVIGSPSTVSCSESAQRHDGQRYNWLESTDDSTAGFLREIQQPIEPFNISLFTSNNEQDSQNMSKTTGSGIMRAKIRENISYAQCKQDKTLIGKEQAIVSDTGIKCDLSSYFKIEGKNLMNCVEVSNITQQNECPPRLTQANDILRNVPQLNQEIQNQIFNRIQQEQPSQSQQSVLPQLNQLVHQSAQTITNTNEVQDTDNYANNFLFEQALNNLYNDTQQPVPNKKKRTFQQAFAPPRMFTSFTEERMEKSTPIYTSSYQKQFFVETFQEQLEPSLRQRGSNKRPACSSFVHNSCPNSGNGSSSSGISNTNSQNQFDLFLYFSDQENDSGKTNNNKIGRNHNLKGFNRSVLASSRTDTSWVADAVKKKIRRIEEEVQGSFDIKNFDLINDSLFEDSIANKLASDEVKTAATTTTTTTPAATPILSSFAEPLLHIFSSTSLINNFQQTATPISQQTNQLSNKCNKH